MDCFNNKENKIPRKREPNFTPDEKALLAQLVKKRSIIESKLTDGTSVLKKKAAWNLVTEEFNCNAHVHKRDTATLKRAWDNLKATTRKIRAIERGNLLKTGGGPSTPPPPSQQGAIINMVQEAAPLLICEIKNSLDSDGTALSIFENKENEKEEEETIDDNCFLDISEITRFNESQNIQSETDHCAAENPVLEHQHVTKVYYDTPKNHQAEQRKPSDYVRREAVLRIKNLEAKKKIEQQILKTKLETEEIKKGVEEIKKRAAEMEEERNRNLLEISKLELMELKKRLDL